VSGPQQRGARESAGFTLAEVAVTLLIVSIGLVLVLQGLSSSKLAAAETHNRKVARELAQYTLGQVEAGLFWEELDGGGDVVTGTYAEEGYEDFHYELVFGDEEFTEKRSRAMNEDGYHDSWEAERQREERLRDKEGKDDEDEKAVQPFEKVRIQVTYPQLGEHENTLVLERWMAWENVYGTDEEAKETDATNGESEQ
jgi:prepilin-type N-terminal cleavage/methylation domain-containing protein